MHYPQQRYRSVVALCCLAVVAALGAGCTKPAGTTASSGGQSVVTTPGKPRPVAEESWDRDALAEAQPCLLTFSDETPSLRAVKLDGRVVADNLWKPSAASYSLLLDADHQGPRVAVSVGRTATETPAASRDTLLALLADGSVVTASKPTTAFPLVSAAVFMQNGDLLWLRRRESNVSIDTTIGLTDARTGKITPVVLSGKWPKHRFVASLIPLRARTAVAVVLKTDGTSAPHDDYAVVLADYQNGKLVARSAPYRDDTLFTLGPGPEAGTLVYARAAGEESAQADELLELMPSGDRWLPKIVLRNAACDPGFDFQNVCAGGPDRSILFRAATNPAVADPTAWLRELPDGAKTPRNTGVRLNVVGNQWLWLGKPIL